MGMGWYVSLQTPIPGVDGTDMCGKMLIFAQKQLDDLAEGLGLQPLTKFLSFDPEEVAEFIRGEGVEFEEEALWEEEWFDAADGLQTVQGLLARLRPAPDLVQRGKDVVQDLEAIEKVLLAAAAAGVAFHLASDTP